MEKELLEDSHFNQRENQISWLDNIALMFHSTAEKRLKLFLQTYI